MENLEVAGENALSRYDSEAYNQILLNARPNGLNKWGPPTIKLSGVTYLRLSDELLHETNFDVFKAFVRKMHANLSLKHSNEIAKNLQDHCPNRERYYHFTVPLKRSKSRIPLELLLEATEPVEPYIWIRDYIYGTLDEIYEDEMYD
ncbi:hypothetical protein Fmac_019381 [Flemingia macrophylla]|uniref:Uncharacterized protein n=1 Tax=Flemingia macrophylla TaxID=520843 RepID=A0ABD1M7M0_9FABA